MERVGDLMLKIETLRVAEALSAVAFGAAVAYIFWAPDSVIWLASTVAVAGVAAFCLLSPARDAAVRDAVYGEAMQAVARDMGAYAARQPPDERAVPEVARALRDDITATLKAIIAQGRQLETLTGDLLLDHLDAHDLRAHAEQHRARLEGVLERAAAARRILAEDPGPAPVGPVSRLEAHRAVRPDAPPSAITVAAIDKLHQELQAGGLPS